jgi:predicted MFS family arabinose efflux permease
VDGRPWIMLAVLFAARTSTGFAYQSIGSIGPELAVALAVDLAAIGFLIGLFKLPGIALSLPAAALARLGSDKGIVAAGTGLLAVGCALTAGAASFEAAATGRLLTGVGATIANIYFAKMAIDWFDQPRLPLAMGVLVTSWPFGIALGLMAQGAIAASWGWRASIAVSTAACLAAMVLMLAVYREAPGRRAPPAVGLAALRALSPTEWQGVLLACAIWTALNVGLVIVFGFGPALLNERGLDLAAAGRLVALGTWIGIMAIPLGGAAATRWRSGPAIITTALVLAALVYALIGRAPELVWLHVAFGVTAFVAAGPIMALPGEVLTPANRAVGMGIFYTGYYVGLTVAPPIAGWLYDHASRSAPFDLAAVLMLAAAAASVAFVRLLKSRPLPAV